MWISIFSAFLSLSFGQTVLLQSPQSSDSEYQAYLAAHPALQSPTSRLTATGPDRAVRDSLMAEFSELQKAFLSLPPAESRVKMEVFLTRITEQDWGPMEREMFFRSSLRRAQLAQTDRDQLQWLELAASLDPQLRPEAELFPPPLMQNWRKIRSANNFVPRTVSGLGKGWSAVLINGIRCTRSPCLTPNVSGLKVRTTWLSNKWQPQSTVTDASQISTVKPLEKPWLSGLCDEVQFDKAASQFAKKQAFVSLECEAKAKPKSNLELKPLLATRTSENLFQPVEGSRREKVFYKSPWLWAGVGVAVAIIVASTQQTKERREPSTTYGF